MPLPKLKGLTVYLPNGSERSFMAQEVVAYGTIPTIVFVVRKGDELTRYAGFPVVFHEEVSAIELTGLTAVPNIAG